MDSVRKKANLLDEPLRETLKNTRKPFGIRERLTSWIMLAGLQKFYPDLHETLLSKIYNVQTNHSKE